jgi:hypothetical protein
MRLPRRPVRFVVARILLTATVIASCHPTYPPFLRYRPKARYCIFQHARQIPFRLGRLLVSHRDLQASRSRCGRALSAMAILRIRASTMRPEDVLIPARLALSYLHATAAD